jgi:hypothetical protein
MERFFCPCCGYATLGEAPPGTFEICDICFWEDDDVQFRDPLATAGANRVSLTEAQANFIQYGVSELRFREHVRSPKSDEKRNPNRKRV